MRLSSAAVRSCSAPSAIAEAERAYAEVIRRGPQSTFFEQSLYKHGWSLFKLARSDESLGSFGQLLDRKLIDPKDPNKVVDMQTLTRPERELLEDTLRVMSITFSYLDGAQSVDEFVARRGSPRYSHLLYSSLGDLYITKERYQDAAQTYEAFVKRDPDRSQRAAPAGARDRGVSQGRLRFAGPFGQGTVPRALWLRLAILGRPRARPVSCGRG